MSAEVEVWVEVAYVTTVWRRTYGVVPSDGLANVELNEGEVLTGRAAYEPPEGEG